MSNALAPKPTIDFAVKILNGPDKGSIYKLVSDEITIGRMPENDIALPTDEKISRRHAVLRITSQGIELHNLSEKNEVFINKKSISTQILQPNDEIKIGNTKLQFQILNLPIKDSAPSLRSVEKPKRSGRPRESKLNFYIIATVLIGGLLWLLTSESDNKNVPTDFKTDTQTKNQLEKNRLVVDNILSDRRKKGVDSRQYEQAHSFFIRGFRDFQKGQYQRAKDNFQTCRSIFPKYELCTQYYRESEKKFRELVQYYLTIGKEYSDKGQYMACKNAYTNVMIMETSKASTQYQEAASGLDVCDAKAKGDSY